MSFTANSTGGNYREILNQSNIPEYPIGFIPAVVPSLHTQWNNLGITGSQQTYSREERGYIVQSVNENITDNENKIQYGWHINSNGKNQGMNIQQPYIVAFIWRRIN